VEALEEAGVGEGVVAEPEGLRGPVFSLNTEIDVVREDEFPPGLRR
jgi:hypothetical protein